MAKDKISDYSSTAADNTDVGGVGIQGTNNPSNLDDGLREIMSHLADNFSFDTIASASTCDLGSKAASYLQITGTTTITSLGTVKAGTAKMVEFAGVLTLTHNDTSLILPSGINITTAAGDTAVMISEGGGNWRCLSYQRSKLNPSRQQETVFLTKTGDQTTTNTGGVDVTDLSFAVKSGETWEFMLTAHTAMSNAAANTEVGFNGPTVSAGSWTRHRFKSDASVGFPSSSGGLSIGDFTDTAGQDQRGLSFILGRFTFSANGTFAVRFRRSTTAGTATFFAYSQLQAWRAA